MANLISYMQPSVQADDFKSIMKRLPLTADSLDSRGLYVYDDGFRLVVWFGRMLSPDIAMNLLGQDAAVELSKACAISIIFFVAPNLFQWNFGLSIRPKMSE